MHNGHDAGTQNERVHFATVRKAGTVTESFRTAEPRERQPEHAKGQEEGRLL